MTTTFIQQIIITNKPKETPLLFSADFFDHLPTSPFLVLKHLIRKNPIIRRARALKGMFKFWRTNKKDKEEESLTRALPPTNLPVPQRSKLKKFSEPILKPAKQNDGFLKKSSSQPTFVYRNSLSKAFDSPRRTRKKKLLEKKDPETGFLDRAFENAASVTLDDEEGPIEPYNE